MGGGGKIPYPKHVWSPAGGWYGQPKNWRANTLTMGALVLGICTMVFHTSSRIEHRELMPEKGRFFPSRWWSREIREHEANQRAREAS
ncbi:uncharacterized protein DFL_000742 [Arthrobotrys flagrans]|uniref:Uncharacterized protein n=1 Tax=Arthrobotrys flagrans TaxID=97331 RepID=A0A437AEK8_ARTFL|nr:hypothetical protein DFL_000742 [Arthrobotrys flagrans]